ncbi:hypothetical protein [Synechococcus sp. UW69]|uniref:hypothetical protein n=1 Tax=Synechococcus sp. UW69 TaxID=368493 RepID=UPI000E0F13E6|nr:hypothetical protein [Synechococcus sp. UW69]
MKNKAVAIFAGVGLIAAIGLGASLSQQTQDTLKADNLRDAERCINVHNSDAIKGTTTACDRVKTKYLSEEQQEQYAVAYVKHKEVKAKKAAEAKEKDSKEAKARQERLSRQRAEREARGEWTYSGYIDDATGKRAKTARLTSKNSMNFGFPYSGTQYGRFTVRNHPRHGVDAFLQIDQGQLLCDNYSNTSVLIRFDNGPATRYGCQGAADHSSEIVFIQNVAGLEARMKTAKKMYITVSVYQEGSRTWEFNVKGYDRSKV